MFWVQSCWIFILGNEPPYFNFSFFLVLKSSFCLPCSRISPICDGGPPAWLRGLWPAPAQGGANHQRGQGLWIVLGVFFGGDEWWLIVMGINVGGGFLLLRTRENNSGSNWDNTWERDCDDDGLWWLNLTMLVLIRVYHYRGVHDMIFTTLIDDLTIPCPAPIISIHP